MSHELENLWNMINVDLFGGRLKPLNGVEWAQLSGPDGINAHGRYWPKSRIIAIDERFKFDVNAASDGDMRALSNADIAMRLLIHEMVHQALDEADSKLSGKHGEEFLAEAQRISRLMNEPSPTIESIDRWPVVR